MFQGVYYKQMLILIKTLCRLTKNFNAVNFSNVSSFVFLSCMCTAIFVGLAYFYEILVAASVECSSCIIDMYGKQICDEQFSNVGDIFYNYLMSLL